MTEVNKGNPKGKSTIHLVPQSHIDVVWLWRYDPDTIHRCCKPTFSRALENLAEFPDYVFNASQVPLYEPMSRHYPEIFKGIRERVAEGRWEIVGGMYVECEGGEPCGEALARQCVMGKRYFRKTFGVDVQTGWQQDAWSHPSQLPQIFRKSGINSYMFLRGEKGEKLFWWEAPDGSRVLAVRPFFHARPPFEDWDVELARIRDGYGVDDVMFKIGGGDHGGGASADNIRTIHAWAEAMPGDIEVRFSTFSQYLATIEPHAKSFPVIADELGFQLRGDLTNCCEIKAANRRGENLLMAAERWATLASVLTGAEYPEVELQLAWEKLLFNQFHDTLGGSVIPPAYDDTMCLYASVQDSGEVLSDLALQALAAKVDTTGDGRAIVVFNPTQWPRSGMVHLRMSIPYGPPSPACVRDEKGGLTPCRCEPDSSRYHEPDEMHRVSFFVRDIPAFGYATVHLVKGVAAMDGTLRQAGPLCIENEYLRVSMDEATGYISSAFDKRTNRELIAGGRLANMLVAIEDEGDSEGRFKRGDDYSDRTVGAEHPVVSTQPISASLESGTDFLTLCSGAIGWGQSSFKMRATLRPGIPYVEFECEVDWSGFPDAGQLIKIAFPLAMDAPSVFYDAPYHVIQRPADGTEYPAQKWVELFEDGFGVALLNDSRYAHDVQGGVVRLNVLRSMTEPAANTEAGRHIVRYALYAHARDWRGGGVVEQGYGFNYPLQAIAMDKKAGAGARSGSWIGVSGADGDQVVLEVVKRAYDSDAVVLRFCEMHRKSAEVKVRLPFAVASAAQANLLEEIEAELEVTDGVVSIHLDACEIVTVILRR